MAVGGKVALVLLLFIMVTNAVEGAVTCQLVVSSLTPCAYYITNGGPVPGSCCKSMNSLKNAASTTADLQTACKCMEKAIDMIPNFNSGTASSIPGKCDAIVPYKITLTNTTDCSKVL